MKIKKPFLSREKNINSCERSSFKQIMLSLEECKSKISGRQWQLESKRKIKTKSIRKKSV